MACRIRRGALHHWKVTVGSGAIEVGASSFMRADDPRERDLEKEAREQGLQIPHAYGVLDVRTVAGLSDAHGARAAAGEDGSPVHVVKLRNPNGRAGWKGAWCRGDTKRWSHERKEELRPEREDEGVFWMAWDDFFKFFAELTVCRLLPDHLEVEQKQQKQRGSREG